MLIEAFAAALKNLKGQNHTKKSVTTANRRAGVYNRAGGSSVTFCKTGDQTDMRKAQPFGWAF